MPTVITKSLIDGMVLASAASSLESGVVLPAGSIVTRDAVKKLTAARIDRVEVTVESFALAEMLPEGQGRSTADREAEKKAETHKMPAASDTTQVQANLIRVAHMFNSHREDPLMRELCRLAIKCAQERLIRV